MNWVDIVILVVWGIAALWGLWAGLLRMLLPLLVIALGIFLASHLAEPIGNIFSPFTDKENIQTITAFVVIFIALLLVAGLVGFMLRAVMRFLVIFGLVDRLAGMLVGILAGFVLLSGALTAVQKYPVAGVEGDIHSSTLGEFLADNFDVVIRGIKLIPGDWDDKVRELK
jgi:membrane protein required for colicin V production